ncbi:T9SS type A sorting domain-containing protein [Kaistella daneshvariae]
MDVKNLPVGSYILGIKTENGFTTKKFIKKYLS